MKVYIPTIKFTDNSKGIDYPIYNHSFTAEQLAKLNITPDLLEQIWRSFGDTCVRKHANGTSYQMFLEPINEQHSYRGRKLDYLNKYGVKVATGWVLPISKGFQFTQL